MGLLNASGFGQAAWLSEKPDGSCFNLKEAPSVGRIFRHHLHVHDGNVVPLKEAGFQLAVPPEVPYFSLYFNVRLCVKNFLDVANPQFHDSLLHTTFV